MYAVIKTGGKQYRVQPGDVLVVEKLDGQPGETVTFGEVLLVGEGESVAVGAPRVDGAEVSGTLVETRKGEKIKVFKKIRRQGYRRTGGHRQIETVVRVTAISGPAGKAAWDGTVDLTPRAELVARARGLAAPVAAAAVAEAAPSEIVADAAPEAPAKAPARRKAAKADGETAAAKPAAKKSAAKAAKSEADEA